MIETSVLNEATLVYRKGAEELYVFIDIVDFAIKVFEQETFYYPFDPSFKIYATDQGSLCYIYEGNSWPTQSGKLTATLIRLPTECDRSYVVDIVIEDLTFIDSNGNEKIVDRLEFKNTYVNDQYL